MRGDRVGYSGRFMENDMQYPETGRRGLSQMRRTVNSAFLVAAADIAVLFPFLRLVLLLVHDASAVGTEEQAVK